MVPYMTGKISRGAERQYNSVSFVDFTDHKLCDCNLEPLKPPGEYVIDILAHDHLL